MKNIFFIAIIPFTLCFCNPSETKEKAKWTKLPEVTSLDSLKQTIFVPTLENPIDENKNIVYAPAFLYAWNKIVEKLGHPIRTSNLNSPDFQLLVKSDSYKNTLRENDYSVEAEVLDGAIIAKAFFNKTLPFKTKLYVIHELFFNKTKVAAFGMEYFDEEVVKQVQILYYKSDDNFILKLIPKDKQHEIILTKGIEKYKSLKDGVKVVNDLIKKGKKERMYPKNSWKYSIVEKDIFIIPIVNFNVETRYKNIEGQQFFANDNKKHVIEEAYQRTGFILNENGAVVESQVAIAVDSVGAEPEISHPKKMIFDKEFLIIVKRTGKVNPYFVMKVNNAELLTKK